MKRLATFLHLAASLLIGSLCACAGDSSSAQKTASLGGVETTGIKAAVVTEELHQRVTARLDENATRRLLVLIGRGRPPKVTKIPYNEDYFVPSSYRVHFSGGKTPLRVSFFGRCQSCIVNGETDFDFGDADARILVALIDPKHLWVY